MEKTINKVELNGYAGMDAQMRELSNGKTMTRFTLATNENYKNNQGEWVKDTAWHNITVWNGTSSKAAELVKKGSRVSLTGKITYREYTDKLGQKRNVAEIIAQDFSIIK